MKYAEALDIAEVAFREASDAGHRFRSGVVRAAALAAADMSRQLDVRNAMVRVFFDHLLPPSRSRWDGSIA
jgi:hypothetical protein